MLGAVVCCAVLVFTALVLTGSTGPALVLAGVEMPVLGLLALGLPLLGVWRDASRPVPGQGSASTDAPLRSDEELLHEVRSTVAGIAMTHRFLHEHASEVAPEQRSRLESLEEAELSRLERMVTRRGGPAEVERAALSDVLRPIVEALRVRGAEIRWVGVDPVVRLPGDDLAEIVHILLDNALVHAPGAPIEVAVTEEEGVARISVSDHGPGVPHAARPLVFARGFRASRDGGQGLGLHVARRLARTMSGDLQLLTSAGRGCTFLLTVPTDRETSCHAHSA